MRLTITILCAVLLSSCSRVIGHLTVLANRNIEFNKNHVLVKRDAKGKSRGIVFLSIPWGKPTFEEAMDNAIRKQGAGEYFRNVEISSFRKWWLLWGTWGYVIQGDIYGYEDQRTKSQIEAQISGRGNFNKGDEIRWKKSFGGFNKGKIVAFGDNYAIVSDENNNETNVDYDKLIKVENSNNTKISDQSISSQNTINENKQPATQPPITAPAQPVSSTSLPANNVGSINKTCTVLSDGINMRSGAGKSFSPITQLNKGDNVMLLDNSNSDWWQVSFQGKQGYVSSKYLSPQ